MLVQVHVTQKHECRVMGIRTGREEDHGWLAFLAVTVTSSPGFSLTDKRKEPEERR